ncbi:MAG: hypothetical protein ACK58N_20715 [Synechocystis sp.]
MTIPSDDPVSPDPNCHVTTTTHFQNAIHAITDKDALDWFHRCGLYFEPFR